MNDSPIIELAEFEPTPAMRMAKARLFARLEECPLVDVDSMNMTMAIQLSGNQTVKTWWDKPGFKDYFLNKFEWRSKIEYLAQLSLETAESILLDEEAPAAAKVNLIKTINELANKLPARNKEIKYADAAISSMDSKALDEFIEKQQKLLAVGEEDR